jgi:ABC-type transport system substrate-binding protein
MIPIVPRAFAQPKIDVLRYVVIMDPDAQIEAMQNCFIDVLTGLTRPADVEKLDAEGFTIVDTLGFYISFIGFNVRADQSYRRPEITFWPLADVNFRHALAHSFDRETIVNIVGGFIKIPVNSMVPRSIGGWFNPEVDPHPFNLGNPFDITSLTADAVAGQIIVNVADVSIFEVGDSVWIADESADDNWELNVVSQVDPINNQLTLENALINTYTVAANGVVAIHDHSTCSILREGRYTFVDADDSGTLTLADYWEMPNGEPLPDIHVLTPFWEEDPQGFEIVEYWIDDLADIGLAGIPQNNLIGLMPDWIESDFLWNLVYNERNFDAFIISFRLDRFPDYLYDWFHSRQDFPGGGNAFGVDDTELDDLLEIIKFSLDHTAKLEACWAAQERLAEILPTIPVHSNYYFDAFKPGLLGIVKSPGFGADNMWTYLNIHWEPGHPNERIEDGRGVVIWCLKDEPDLFNQLSGNRYAWEIMDRVFDPLRAVNPYNLGDIPWIATDWEVVETPIGIDATYYLRNDIFWQDGEQYTAWDAEFSLEFIRDNQIPRYRPAWQNITDVEVIDDYTFTVHANVTSQFLIYDWAALAALLPPQVWGEWDGLPLDEILARDLSLEPGWNGVTPTNLFGTGPFIFQFYDDVALFGDLWANENYFLTTQEIHDLKVEMFHEIGDVNRDGYIDVFDLSRLGVSYGKFSWEPGYDPDADLNQDGVVDARDLALITWHWGEQREYPIPTEDP